MNFFGADFTGRKVDVCNYLGSENHNKLLLSVHENVASFPCGVMMERSVCCGHGKEAIFQGLCLPLADNDGTVRYYLSALDTDDPVGRSADLMAPRNRFDLSSMDFRRVHYVDLGAGIPARAYV
ncbi:hypothetical protein GCM10017044_16690 [Kordiimonas sediminis]|uniref:Uncharacterized protein n=1 Tax=Kordiimonas sediminis TaxID=1735581 RepID=A0A919E641_9PROT|nr:hypothetical protein GCM10017044_16690 [Kordiimonas sediminis]